MPSLAETQAAMRAYLLEEPGSAALSPECLGAAESVAAGLATYRGTCLGTLVNALRLSYPAVRRVLGAEYFDAIAAQFAREEPPASAYLNDYGARFAQFAADQPGTVALAYLRDLGTLEWAVNRALHAPDVPGVALERLLGLDPDTLARVCFRVHPGVSLLQLHSPAQHLWKAVLEGDEPALRQIDPSSAGGWVLIERDQQLSVQVRSVPQSVGTLSAQLFAGRPLYDALVQAPGDPVPGADEAAAQAPADQLVLADHLLAGRFVDFWMHESIDKEYAS